MSVSPPDIVPHEQYSNERATRNAASEGLMNSPTITIEVNNYSKPSNRHCQASACRASKCQTCFHKSQVALDYISFLIQTCLEETFYLIARKISSRPVLTLIFALLISAILSCGCIYLDQRNDPDVWLPRGSTLQERQQFVKKVFPIRFYQQTVLLIADDNLLRPDVILFMEELDRTIRDVTFKNLTYDDLCVRPGAIAPISKDGIKFRKRRSTADEVDTSTRELQNLIQEHMKKTSHGNEDPKPDSLERKSSGTPLPPVDLFSSIAPAVVASFSGSQTVAPEAAKSNVDSIDRTIEPGDSTELVAVGFPPVFMEVHHRTEHSTAEMVPDSVPTATPKISDNIVTPQTLAGETLPNRKLKSNAEGEAIANVVPKVLSKSSQFNGKESGHGTAGVKKDKEELPEFIRIMAENDPELMEMIEQFMKESGKGGPCIKTSILPVFQPKQPKDSDTVVTYTVEELEAQDLGRLLTNAIRKKTLATSQNLTVLMSGIEGKGGGIKVVKATLMVWLIMAPSNPNPRSPEMLDIQDWERQWIQSVLNLPTPRGVHLRAFMEHSYPDAMTEVVDENMPVLFFGFTLTLIYVILTLGRCNVLQQRIYVSLVGLAVVGLSLSASYGFCSFVGLPFGPIHPILPFLILGIGVDDMFVIVQSMDNLSVGEKKLPVNEQISRALKQSGASITITSLTDVVAFGIGATTAVPSLAWFCLYAAAGIICVFVLQLCVFVPFLVLDEQRRSTQKEACCWSAVSDEYVPNNCSQRNLMVEFIDRIFAPLLLTWPVKILVLLITAACVGVNLWGVVCLRYNFRPEEYIKDGTYQDVFLTDLKAHFPLNGDEGAFYIGPVNYLSSQSALLDLYQGAKNNPYIKSTSVDFWLESMIVWLEKEGREMPLDNEEFQNTLREFLVFSKSGMHYVKDMIITGNLLGEFNVTASLLRFQHIPVDDGPSKEAAIGSVNALESQANQALIKAGFDGERAVAAFCRAYVSWEANMSIAGELIRNLGLTLIAVFSVTLVLIGDFRISLWVFLCVVLTLIDIGGSMHFWGLYIEILTSITLILACGLAVDYSAHVGHMFVTQRGSRGERAHTSLVKMGPAVFSGGFSTFLAFVMLSYTDAYVFYTFFKVLLLVVVYGLFHGLCFLPVILSLVGPSTVAPWALKRKSFPTPASAITIPLNATQDGFLDPEESEGEEDQIFRPRTNGKALSLPPIDSADSLNVMNGPLIVAPNGASGLERADQVSPTFDAVDVRVFLGDRELPTTTALIDESST